MVNGWVKIHRKVIEKAWFKKSAYVHLWTYLLIKASYSGKEYLWNGEIIKLKPGQFVTGRKQISQDLGIPETSIERMLTFFEKNEHQIGQQKTNTSRLISIHNYHLYQDVGQQTDNGWTTDGQRMDTNKESKERKEAAGAHDENKIIEFLMDATNREFIKIEQIKQEAKEFKKKYDGMKIGNLRTLCNTWARNIKPWQEKKLSDFI